MNKIIIALNKHATDNPDSLAFLSDYHQVSYGQLNMLVNRCSTFLLQNGVQPNSRCILVSGEVLLNIVASLSLMKIGASQLNLTEHQLSPEILKKTKLWNIDKLISDKTLSFDFLCNIKLDWNRVITTEAYNTFPSYNIDQPCLLITGSGTTGEAKNWEVSFKQIDERIHTLLKSAIIKSGERHFSCVDYYFPSGAYRFWTCLIMGACNVFHLNKGKSYDDTICDFKVDHVYGTTLHAQNMLERYDLNKHRGLRFPDLKSFTLTGSTISINLQEAVFEKLTNTLTTAYGTNECGGVSMAKPDMLKQYPGTLGQAYPDVQLEIVNKHDQVLPKNETGYLRVKTLGMVFNYGIGDEQGKPIPALKDGWFYPNDLAYVNEEGLLFLQGRSDDLIIHDGINIYPKEIEDILESHPYIKAAVAYPLELTPGANVPAASIILNTPEEPSILQEIASYARRNLGSKAPGFISVENEFPRNERGKVLKRQLKEKAQRKFQGP